MDMPRAVKTQCPWGPCLVGLLLQLLFALGFFSYTRVSYDRPGPPAPGRSPGPASTPTPPVPRPLLILLWTWPFHTPVALSPCSKMLPGTVDCQLTANRSLYPQADAVIVHHREVSANPGSQLPPQPRPPDQRWVWFSLESPSHCSHLSALDGYFNLTMSYRSDSDIFTPYGWLEPWPEPPVQIQVNLSAKTDLVAWAVSNWNSKSARVQYYENLKSHLRVDVYGRGHKPLPKGNMTETLARYKFYLAFENSLHPDYITEKLWRNALEAWAVPVVLGPSRKNYERFLPPDAFIHVDDFKSPGDLARYLQELDRDSLSYQRYFRWRKTLPVEHGPGILQGVQAAAMGPEVQTVPNVVAGQSPAGPQAMDMPRAVKTQCPWRPCLIGLLLQLLFALGFFSYTRVSYDRPGPPAPGRSPGPASTPTPPVPRPLLILLWTWPFHTPVALSPCSKMLPGTVDCQLTANRSLYPQADAVIVHHREVSANPGSQLPPQPRPPDQRWVWFSLESPSHCSHLSALDGYFNLTMSYRSDSDIFTPYGWLEPWPEPPVQIQVNLSAKTDLVAWAVSNWNSKSARVQYYENLKSHLRVDVYGRGHKPLPKGNMTETLARYKFYLAFENSLHPDYITEKLWRNALEAWAVPVVLGPSRKNYERFLPPDAFIHVDDFKSPGDLARYLQELDRDSLSYQRYFRWRKTLPVEHGPGILQGVQAAAMGPEVQTVPNVVAGQSPAGSVPPKSQRLWPLCDRHLVLASLFQLDRS